MKDKLFGILQRVGRAFMLPIAILPVAGLLLGIGGSLTNATMLEAYGLMGILGPGTFASVILGVMRQAGDIVFANLPIIFAMGVAIGMAKKEKEVAALAAAVAFFIMHASISAMIETHGGAGAMHAGATASVCGIASLQMGVFGGIVVGLGVAGLHNRFYKIELPQVLSFFGGTRFVPIVSGLVYVPVGIAMYYVWPVIQECIYALGGLVMESGYLGTWIYGLLERALIPFGLHHVFYLPFWQTALGGTMEVAGRVVEGAQNIFFAQLADPTVEQFAVSATRFMSGKFPLMIFGLPGAALAMYRMAKPEKKKKVFGLLLSAAVTAMLTGITEPIEFTFLFVAPVLYAIHCVLAGLAYMLMHMLGVGVGMTFSGGLIDMFLFGILQGNDKTHWVWIVVVGIAYFALYYFLFTLLIGRLNLKTPGRFGSTVGAAVSRAGADSDSLCAEITRGLGGKENISDVDCCATRLRCTVYKAGLVDDEVLRATGASGVVRKGKGVQIIYGPRVTTIKTNLTAYLETEFQEETAPVSLPQEEAPEQESLSTVVISSPITGTAHPLEETPDAVFAGGMMGQGAMVMPEDGTIVAPEDGEITFVFNTKHAVGLQTDSGISLLIHIGIDTVKLDGKGFEVLVRPGDHVKKGTPLVVVDLAYVRANAPSLATPVLCTELSSGQKLRLLATGPVQAGQPLYAIDTQEA